jgi:hypothetical protein
MAFVEDYNIPPYRKLNFSANAYRSTEPGFGVRCMRKLHKKHRKYNLVL